MGILPIDTRIDADRVLDLLGKDFKFDHAKGIAELIKNSVDAYIIEGLPDSEQVIIISVKTSGNDYIKEIELIDFCGMSKEKIDQGFVYWFSNVAASLTKEGYKSNIKTLGGHGNGGKFYMRQMFKESYLITYLNNKMNIFGFDDKKRYGYDKKYCDFIVNANEALGIAGLKNRGIPNTIIQNIINGKNGFTIIRGINPVKSRNTNYRLKLAEKIINNPQSQRLIKRKEVFFQSLPNLDLHHLNVPNIEPKKGFEEPYIYTCPDTIELFENKIELINNKYPQNISLLLYTSDIPLSGLNYKGLNRIDFLGKMGVIASYSLSEIGLFSSGFTEFIYGECNCSIMEDKEEDYVKNDRVNFVRGDRSEALLKWVQDCVNDLAKKMEERQKEQRKERDLQETSNFNKILNTWNQQFLRAMLKDQLFGNGKEPGYGGNDNEFPYIGSNKGTGSNKKAKKSVGQHGGTESRKIPSHPIVLISSTDTDPLSQDGSTYHCDPRQPAVHQRPIDVKNRIYWINTSKEFADLILKKYSANSSKWRFYLFQRHLDIIIKEAIYQMGKRELSITADDVAKMIETIVSNVHDKAASDLEKFLFDENYKL